MGILDGDIVRFDATGTGPNGSFQEFVAPVTGLYEIKCAGAEGATLNRGSYDHGMGARIRGTFFLTQNDKLAMVVGHKGVTGPSDAGQGGGGGTFVAKVEQQHSGDILGWGLDLNGSYHATLNSGTIDQIESLTFEVTCNFTESLNARLLNTPYLELFGMYVVNGAPNINMYGDVLDEVQEVAINDGVDHTIKWSIDWVAGEVKIYVDGGEIHTVAIGTPAPVSLSALELFRYTIAAETEGDPDIVEGIFRGVVKSYTLTINGSVYSEVTANQSGYSVVGQPPAWNSQNVPVEPYYRRDLRDTLQAGGLAGVTVLPLIVAGGGGGEPNAAPNWADPHGRSGNRGRDSIGQGHYNSSGAGGGGGWSQDGEYTPRGGSSFLNGSVGGVGTISGAFGGGAANGGSYNNGCPGGGYDGGDHSYTSGGLGGGGSYNAGDNQENLPGDPVAGNFGDGWVEIRLVNPKQITGVITDADGNPCQRSVYCLTRPTDGSLPELLSAGLSDPVTGEYTLTIPFDTEVSRVVVSEDDADPLLNDLIDRIIPG